MLKFGEGMGELFRDLLNEVWASDETQQYLVLQLESHRPVALKHRSGRDVRRPAARRRTGPYARPVRGGSDEVSRDSIASFFARREGDGRV